MNDVCIHYFNIKSSYMVLGSIAFFGMLFWLNYIICGAIYFIRHTSIRSVACGTWSCYHLVASPILSMCQFEVAQPDPHDGPQSRVLGGLHPMGRMVR